MEEDDIELQAKSRAAQNEIENETAELTKFFEKKREIDKEQSKRVEDRGGSQDQVLLTSKRKAGDSKKDQGKEPFLFS